MTRMIGPLRTRLTTLALALLAMHLAPDASWAQPSPKRPEPVAYIGHGALFDSFGRELVRTPQSVAEAQDWYRTELSGLLTRDDRSKYAAIERELLEATKPGTQERLVVNALLLQWLVERAKVDQEDRLMGKLRVLNGGLLERRLAAPDAQSRAALDAYQMPPVLGRRLERLNLLAQSNSSINRLQVTAVSGAAYRQLCADRGVPLPPDFGPGSAWVSRGTIANTDLFIARRINAEVLTFTSTTPSGLCIALPRFDATNTVQLDGIICLGQADPSSGLPKVCFWDNQIPTAPLPGPAAFTFQRGSAQAISQWVGGSDLRGSAGGVCSDCHAGENPYVIHGPVLDALRGATGGLTFPPAPGWHEPIVRTGDVNTLGAPLPWPENPGPMNSPVPCRTCHGLATSPSFAGRFPHLSINLPAYCDQVFRAAVGASMFPTATSPGGVSPAVVSFPIPSMPPGGPGSLSCTPNRLPGDSLLVACNANHTVDCNPLGFDPTTMANRPFARRCTPELASLLALCGSPAVGDAASRGDPHNVTFNGTRYDFQPAGEFVMLRSAAGFEVQVRQTAVSTASPVGPDAHTGLTSCVSVHTAVAARVGNRRVTFQPAFGDNAARGLEVRIDGKPVLLGKKPLGVDGGRVMRTALGDGLEIDFPDRAKLIAVPGFWGAPNNLWYLNIEVFNAAAREGMVGSILPGQWLPLLPDGTPLGPRPASLALRHDVLNVKFADAWRVDSSDSLFDYAPGTGPSDFVLRDWPPTRPPCVVPGSSVPPAQPMDIGRAREICSKLADKTIRAQCTLDVAATGDQGFMRTYLRTERVRASVVLGP